VIEAGSEDEALAQEDGNPHIGFDRVPLDLDKQSHARGQLNKLLSRPAIAWRRIRSSGAAMPSLLLLVRCERAQHGDADARLRGEGGVGGGRFCVRSKWDGSRAPRRHQRAPRVNEAIKASETRQAPFPSDRIRATVSASSAGVPSPSYRSQLMNAAK